ncbi:PREDICTED: DNA mismatch repair protein Msh2-like, partial [Rhagoletis zephyria]|uniref:DNA mismatch repair protein Msh2-like n=1 Tax=Rhagoletis zephyria TaxID=28612 RepID=UPI00081191AA
MADDSAVTTVEVPNEPTFVAFFKSMTKCDSKVIRLFYRGGYHTIHGEAAVMVANNFLNTCQAIKNIGPENNQLESVSISDSRFETLLHYLLVENNYQVEIYTKGKSDNDWKLKSKATPGNLGEFEYIIDKFNHQEVINQNTAALYLDFEGLVHFACVNSTNCTISLSSFADNNSYTRLESLIVQLNPKDNYIPDPNSLKKIENIVKKLVKENFTSTTLSEILTNNQKALIPFNGLLELLNILNDPYCESNYHLKTLNYETFVRLDLSSISNLHLFPKSSDKSKNVHSLFQVLNHCKSASGRKLLDSYIRQPLTNLKHIEQRLDIVEFFCQNPGDITSRFHNDFLAKIPDITKVYKKFTNGRCKLQDVFQVFQVVELLPTMLDAFDYDSLPESVKIRIYDRLKDVLTELEPFKKLASESIDFEHFEKTRQFWMNASVNDELVELKNEMEALEPLARKESNEVLRDLQRKFDIDRSEFTMEIDDQFGYYFRVLKKGTYYKILDDKSYEDFWMNASVSDELVELKNEMEALEPLARKESNEVLRDLQRKFDIDRSEFTMEIDDQFGYYFRVLKKGTYYKILDDKSYEDVPKGGSIKDGFISKKIKDINIDFDNCSRNYEELQQTFIAEFIDQTRQYMEPILKLEKILAYIDVLVAFAKAAQQANYTRPKMLPKGSGRLVLKKFRHPIIEIIKDMSFVANSITFDKDAFKFYVITGPNMGGKSTFIRSVAISVLMAQIGSFVPCEEATISIVDAIYTRISASDNPALGLSTFMSEMVEAAAILRSSTSDSLIVIDELGRSTGTFDGFGIAQGISECLANTTKAYTLFATHFHHLAMDIPTVGRLAMKTSMVEDVFVNHYEAEEGTATNSFGIELAKSVGMPERIIQRAAS